MTDITKDLLRSWNACADGYRWFCEKFPHGGGFHEVNRALVTEKRYDDSRWLADKAFAAAMSSGSVMDAVKIAGADAESIAADAKEIAASASGGASTTSDWANAATTGNRAHAATTGEGAHAATTGEGANAATTGYRANAATTGYRANAATTGYRANAATTGYGAHAATTGEGAVAACLGRDGKAMAGANGCIVIGWWDNAANRPRAAVGYVGENGIKAGVWYRVKAGQIVEAA